MRFRDYRFSNSEPPCQEEKALADRGLYSLSGYLSYWADIITKVTDTVPAEQLLVTKTEDLHKRSEEIARFCGVRGGAAPAERTHAFVNTSRFGVLKDVPERHLYQVAQKVCDTVMATHFPERDIKQDIFDIRAS